MIIQSGVKFCKHAFLAALVLSVFAGTAMAQNSKNCRTVTQVTCDQGGSPSTTCYGYRETITTECEPTSRCVERCKQSCSSGSWSTYCTDPEYVCETVCD